MRPDPLFINERTLVADGARSTIKNEVGAKFFTIQVKGVGAGATAWTATIEGSNNEVNWSSIVAHGTADLDATLKNSGATPWAPKFVRINLTGLTLAPATALGVFVNGLP